MLKDVPLEEWAKAWSTEDPERLVGRGHPVGDFLAADRWVVLEREPGRLRVRCALVEAVRNPKGELFGGFTPTYVDFFALFVFHQSRAADEPRQWLATTHLRVDYFAPVQGPEFEMAGHVVHKRDRSAHVEIRFEAGESLCALAHATLLERKS
ncbi:MAG: PaaI family thioesterase [Myxococcota bacterium]